MIGSDEGIILGSTDGEVLGSTPELWMVSHLDSMKELSWVIQMSPLMVLMKELCLVLLMLF